MGVRHYRLALTTVGPVHIGTGKTIGKRDYFLDRGKMAVLDARQFVGKLDERQLDDYCRFLEQAEGRQGIGLEDYLDGHKDVRRKAEQSVAYRVPMRLEERKGRRQYLDVAECVKDAYGMPYAPGSSIKGMLRTVLLTGIILADRSAFVRLGMDDKAVQGKAFRQERPDPGDPDVVNDIMRYVSVSDSASLSTDALVFAQKYDRFSRIDQKEHESRGERGGRAEGNRLNIYRESIRPGTRIEASLDIDDRIDAYLPVRLDSSGLGALLEASYDLYERCFLSHFDIEEATGDKNGEDKAPDDGRCRYVYTSGVRVGKRCPNTSVNGTCYCGLHKSEAVVSPDPCICYLGGGVDFDSKTVVNALFPDEYESPRLNHIAHTLYDQFPTLIAPRSHDQLRHEIAKAGFEAHTMKKRGHQTKEDHRHWRDPEFGVSPHTLKLGIVEGKKYPMGKCSLIIEERR